MDQVNLVALASCDYCEGRGSFSGVMMVPTELTKLCS